MATQQIMVVEDESAVRELLAATLLGAGYDVSEAESAGEAQRMLADSAPSLVLLDWMLPGMSGLEFTKWLKKSENLAEIPIIMLTARDDESYKVQGLEAGVDDYVTKPFSTRELLARIKAVLRRAGSDGSEIIRVNNRLELDLVQHRVLADEIPVSVGPTEFKLLHFFMTHPDRAFTRSQLLDQVWGDQIYVEERTVDVHIRRLRKVLEPSGHDRLLQTVRGVGYRFSDKE